MYRVTTTNPKCKTPFWLKSTTWSFSKDRGDTFPTKEAAHAALQKSRKFNQAWAYVHAIIEEA